MDEQYIGDMQAEAASKTEAMHNYLDNLCWIGLEPLYPDSYFENQKDYSRFNEPKRTAQKDARKDAGITLKDKMLAWFSDDAKKQLKEKEAAAKKLQEEYYEYEEKHIDRQREHFYKEKDEHNKQIDQLIECFRTKEKTILIQYFEDALCSDEYTAGYEEKYEIEAKIEDFNAETGELQLIYRLPRASEIETTQEYLYDSKTYRISAIPMADKIAGAYKLRIARSIMLRAIAMVYLSDMYRMVNKINVTGFVRYSSQSSQIPFSKNVMKVAVDRASFDKMDLERISIDSFFKETIKAQTATGLYKKPEYELVDI